jgi:hypothetical protein
VSAGAESVSCPRRRKQKEQKIRMNERRKDKGNIKKVWQELWCMPERCESYCLGEKDMGYL